VFFFRVFLGAGYGPLVVALLLASVAFSPCKHLLHRKAGDLMGCRFFKGPPVQSLPGNLCAEFWSVFQFGQVFPQTFHPLRVGMGILPRVSLQLGALTTQVFVVLSLGVRRAGKDVGRFPVKEKWTFLGTFSKEALPLMVPRPGRNDFFPANRGTSFFFRESFSPR